MENKLDYGSRFIFNKEMNKTIKRSVRARLDVLLAEEEKSLGNFHERCKHLINKTRQANVIRNYNKRINALKIVIWMLTDLGMRTGDLPDMITKKPKDIKPKIPKLKELPAPPVTATAIPTISPADLQMLLNLAKAISPK